MLYTDDFINLTYEIRLTAKDISRNDSAPYTASYSFKEYTLSAQALSTNDAGFRNELSWTMENTDDLLGYNVYRKTSAVGDYKLIAKITGNTYTDNDLKTNQAYYYYVEAAGSSNNFVKRA